MHVMVCFIVKGSRLREVSHECALRLIHHYTVTGSTYNEHGQILYLRHRSRSDRTHTILIHRMC
jgi:hypothetical protein